MTISLHSSDKFSQGPIFGNLEERETKSEEKEENEENAIKERSQEESEDDKMCSCLVKSNNRTRPLCQVLAKTNIRAVPRALQSTLLPIC